MTNTAKSRAHPVRVTIVTAVVGYALLTVVVFAVGMLLTHALAGTVGRWDEHVNQWFVRHRTSGWNHATRLATVGLETAPVIAAVAVTLIVFLVARWRREAAVLVIAMLLEISVFLSTTFVVDRSRPAVRRLDSSPSTGSFPSGHTAAATVFFMTVAFLVSCRTRNRAVRIVVWTLASFVVSAVAFARVYRGLHHPTDVMGGALYGAGCIVVAVVAVRAGVREEPAPLSEAA
jgi:membrane-associated phospholipid phosphatase